MLYKFLTALGRQRLESAVVKTSFNADILKPFHLVGDEPFAANLSAVFHKDLGSLDYLVLALGLRFVKFSLEGFDVRGQILKG